MFILIHPPPRERGAADARDINYSAMLPLLLLLLLVILQQSDGRHAGPAVAYMHMLSPTEQHCTKTRHCIGEQHFCHNGSVCMRERCWRLPNFPCAHTEWCDERLRSCRRRTCESWRDCDDAVYCNGEERCIAGYCVLEPGSDCTGAGDLCDERAQRCTRVQSVQAARARLLDSGYDVHATSVAVHAMDSNTSNTTAPVGSISNTELAWILVGVCSLVCVFIFFWFIANSSRRRAPAILIDHKSEADGGSQVYTEEVNY